MAENKKEKNKKDYIQCVGKCRELKHKRNFYKSDKPEYDNLEHYCNVCKSCLRELCYSNGQISIDGIHQSLSYLNKPFIWDIYYKFGSDKFDLGNYIKQLNCSQYKKLTYKDSDKDENIQNELINNTENIENNEINIKELESFWGKGLSVDQYEKLQNFYDEFASEYETDLPAQRLNFKNAAKTQLQADEALMKGEINLYNQLMKTLSSILGDSNVKPVQASGAEANDQITFGVLIKKYENERPISEWKDNEMQRCIDTYMVGHLAKMEGLNNDFVDMYNEAMKDYSVDFSKLNSNEED